MPHSHYYIYIREWRSRRIDGIQSGVVHDGAQHHLFVIIFVDVGAVIWTTLNFFVLTIQFSLFFVWGS